MNCYKNHLFHINTLSEGNMLGQFKADLQHKQDERQQSQNSRDAADLRQSTHSSRLHDYNKYVSDNVKSIRGRNKMDNNPTVPEAQKMVGARRTQDFMNTYSTIKNNFGKSGSQVPTAPRMASAHSYLARPKEQAWKKY